MSLLEKATSGKPIKETPLTAHGSLFAKATAAANESISMAVSESSSNALHQPFPSDAWEDLEKSLAELPPFHDSLLLAWSRLSESLPLAALSLFIPKGEFLALAAGLGFPASSDDSIPASIAPFSSLPSDPLGSEARALVGQVLGVQQGLPLRATSIWSASCLAGLWIYHDDRLESTPSGLLERLGRLLASVGSNLPALSMSSSSSQAPRDILDLSRKYPVSTVFRLDLPPAASYDESLRCVRPETCRSILLAACSRILSQGGAAFASGDTSVACILGSSSPSDPDLVLFQFSKTLRRIIPFLSAAAPPSARAMRLDNSSEDALDSLTRFLHD
jgi:hypothetical protein